MSVHPLSEYIVKHHKTHLIFDFDATMMWIKASWQQWGTEISDELRELDADLWARYEPDRYKGIGPAQNEWVQKNGDAALDILLRYEPEFEMRYDKQLEHNKPLLQAIEGFKEKYHLFIWSSNSRELLESALQQAGMADWFETIVCRETVRFLKPAPEGFEHIYDKKVPKSRYLLVGDSSHDRAAAEASGIDFYLEDFFHLGR